MLIGSYKKSPGREGGREHSHVAMTVCGVGWGPDSWGDRFARGAHV